VFEFDEDTEKILEITEVFLVRYFGQTEAGAHALLRRLLSEYAERIDADFIHHESAFGMALVAHYLLVEGGELGSLREWSRKAGYQSPPAEALEYFRANYFLRASP